MAIEMSVADYANTPKYHKNNRPVAKPTVFKQIREERLPTGVSARKVGDQYIITILEPGDIYALVGRDGKNKGGEIILLTGEHAYLLDLAKKINALSKYAPVSVKPTEI
jgi:hypothetical protein